MEHKGIFRKKEFKFAVVAALFISFIYILSRILFFESDPIIPAIKFIEDLYLSIAEQLSNLILHLSGSQIKILNHIVSLNGEVFDQYVPELWYKRLALVIFIIILLTKAPVWSKSLAGFILLAAHLLGNALHISAKAYSVTTQWDSIYILSIPNSISLLLLFTILVIWYLKHKYIILDKLSKYRISLKFLYKKDISIIIIIYLYIIICVFLLEFFDYLPWINFLFLSTQKILALFGHEAIVDSFLLIGDNGSIYMAKYCLGFKTMFLFSSIVFLTGRNDRVRWIFIFSGLIFLNFVNILRFVFLFIHVQKNGGYTLSIDLHDLYNYITYSIVFIIWIIWFEYFSDLKARKNRVEKG